MDTNTRKIVYYTGNTILFLLKYFCLLLFIFSLGMTLGLTIFSIVKGDNMPNTLIANMVNHITGNDVKEVLEAIVRFGKTDTIVAACGLGFADAITYLLLFFVIGGYSKIFKSLIADNVYTKENFEIIKESVPLSMILLFTQPIIITIIRDLSHINDSFGAYNFIGIPFVIISVLLYLVIDKGLSLENKIRLYERKLAKVEQEKQEAEIMALEKQVRERHAAKAKRRVVKKVDKVEVKEEPKKEVKVEPNKVVKVETKKVTKTEPKKTVKKVEKKEVKKVTKTTTKKTPATKKTVAKTTKKKTSK